MVQRTELFPYRRISSAYANQAAVKSKDRLGRLREIMLGSHFKMQAVLGAIGFLLGRAVILDFLNPFSMAFLAAVLIQEINAGTVAASILVGVLSLGNKELFIKYMVSALAFIGLYALTHRMRVNKKVLTAAEAAIVNLAAGYFLIYTKSGLIYDLFMSGIESVLIVALIFIYDRALPVIKNFKIRKILSTEEIVAFSVLAAFCFVGAEFSLGGLSTKNICIIFLILMFSYYGNAGTGAAVGIALGIIQALSGTILPAAIGVYGLCGLLCGILKGVGKWGVPVGFILGNALMTFYINGSTEVLIKFYEIFAAAFIYMVIPKSLSDKVLSYKTVFSPEYAVQKGFDKRVKGYTMEKLNEVSEVFDALSGTLRDSMVGRDYYSQVDAAQIIDQVVNKSCINCGMCDTCWKREFYKSYQHLFGILSTIESEGDVSFKNIPMSFKERCLKPEEMIMNAKYFHDIYKNGLSWKKKINESRIVVCDQLRAVSSVVSNLALKLDADIKFNRDMEEIILVQLDNVGIHAEDVVVIDAGNGYEIEIKVSACGGKRDCTKTMLPIVNQVTGRKFVKKDMHCNNTHCNNKQGSICEIKLKEAQRFQVATGVARVNKSGTVSGDNYSFMELKDGKYMLALSDGMGTGAKAARESSVTINLLEKFLCAGFEKDIAVKTINSLLLMRSSEESYATIDMTIVNQYKGEVEFVKVGAVSTFIKHEDEVEVIKAGSLPVGILDTIEADFARKKLSDGDFVIMITDGILDCNKEMLNKESWLAEMISNINTRNPQKMADEILNNCLELSAGHINDDMTIMIAKLWETV